MPSKRLINTLQINTIRCKNLTIIASGCKNITHGICIQSEDLKLENVKQISETKSKMGKSKFITPLLHWNYYIATYFETGEIILYTI